MKDFDFHNPTRLIFGRGTISRIGQEVRQAGCRSLLLVAGGGSIRANGVYEAVTASLEAAAVEWTELWGVQPNPVLSKVRQGIAAVRDHQADAVLAVGGGSVLDSGKAIAAGVFLDDVWRAAGKRITLTEALPIFTGVTLSATGSEMNPLAVITNQAEKKKWAMTGPALFPRISIVDPSVQASLPWGQTVNGAIDAMGHVMEQYFTAWGSEATMAVQEALLRTIVAAADRLQEAPQDYPARADLAWAAALALSGICRAGAGTGDFGTHLIEHGLSAVRPDVAHATGLGILFPAWVQYAYEVNPPIFDRWADRVWGAEGMAAGAAAMKAKVKQWGHPTSLRQIGIAESQLAEIAANAAQIGQVGNLVKLKEPDILEVLKLAY